MGDIRGSQLYTLGSIEAGMDLRVSQLYTLVGIKFPAEGLNVSQVTVDASIKAGMTLQVNQLYALVAVKGRVANPKVRAWTFSLDGHDYYVLHLGDAETLVYDLYSEQWAVWGGGETEHWKASTGINWISSGAFPGSFGTNVLVGDDTNGSVYFLDPIYPYDDDSWSGVDGRTLFECQATGQIVMRGPDVVPCNVVQLTGSFGDTYESSLNTVSLEYSDDAGRNYISAGTITIAEGDYAARVEWRSLGSIKAPGRMFRITDAGAVTRIDGLELINDGNDPS